MGPDQRGFCTVPGQSKADAVCPQKLELDSGCSLAPSIPVDARQKALKTVLIHDKNPPKKNPPLTRTHIHQLVGVGRKMDAEEHN